jgi:hypothetical protein
VRLSELPEWVMWKSSTETDENDDEYEHENEHAPEQDYQYDSETRSRNTGCGGDRMHTIVRILNPCACAYSFS